MFLIHATHWFILVVHLFLRNSDNSDWKHAHGAMPHVIDHLAADLVTHVSLWLVYSRLTTGSCGFIWLCNQVMWCSVLKWCTLRLLAPSIAGLVHTLYGINHNNERVQPWHKLQPYEKKYLISPLKTLRAMPAIIDTSENLVQFNLSVFMWLSYSNGIFQVFKVTHITQK